MKLHYQPGACLLAGHIVLEWIGAPYQTARMNPTGIQPPAYSTGDATNIGPMLEHGTLALTENIAILGYLADLHPEAGLFGDGTPRGRAEVMSWLGFLEHEVRKVFLPIFQTPLFLKEDSLAYVLASHARQHIRDCLERFDAQLAGLDWLVGTRSIADPYLFVMLRWATGIDISLYGLNHLMRFARRMELDPGVQAAILAEEGTLAEASPCVYSPKYPEPSHEQTARPIRFPARQALRNGFSSALHGDRAGQRR